MLFSDVYLSRSQDWTVFYMNVRIFRRRCDQILLTLTTRIQGRPLSLSHHHKNKFRLPFCKKKADK